VVLLYRGVYAPGGAPLTRLGRYMAALLACGPVAVLSHRSAACLWGMRAGGPLEVTVAGQRGRKVEGIFVHRSTLVEEDRTVESGIPVTTPGRTITDLADVLDRRALERAIDQAAYLQLDCAGVAVVPGRVGSGLLRRVLGEHRPGSTVTRSRLEDMFLGMCRRRGLPAPEVNVYVEGHLADFVWRRKRLVVETDGRQAHARRAAFERDRWRDAELVTAGWRVLRVTYRRLVREDDRVAEQVGSLLT